MFSYQKLAEDLDTKVSALLRERDDYKARLSVYESNKPDAYSFARAVQCIPCNDPSLERISKWLIDVSGVGKVK